VITPLLKNFNPDNGHELSKFSKSAAALPPTVRKNPPIPFVSKVKKMEKVDVPDADKSDWIKLEFLMDPYNPV
jgi:hypothetical protein